MHQRNLGICTQPFRGPYPGATTASTKERNATSSGGVNGIDDISPGEDKEWVGLRRSSGSSVQFQDRDH